MSKSQRTKGATYEREVCDVFTAALGRKIQRHIGQARDGGNDITVGPLVIECKRRKTLGTVESWFNQAIAAKKKDSDIPIVVARSDGGKSFVMISLDDFINVVVFGGAAELLQVRVDE